MRSTPFASLFVAVTLAAACGGQTGSGTTQADGGVAEGSAGAGGSAGGGGSAGSGGSAGGGGADFSACTGDGQCMLQAPGCCGGPCGPAPLSAFTAIARDRSEAFHDATCDESGGPVDCPLCMTQLDPHFTARCVSGRCEAVDVGPLSTCATDSDCTLRFGAECCATGCDLLHLIAVSQAVDAEIGQWTCGPNPAPCAACPALPNVGAACVGGLCTLLPGG